MSYRFYIALLIAMISSVVTASAQQDEAARRHASILAPLVSEQTVAVAHVDLSQVQLEPLIAESGGLFELAQATRAFPSLLEAMTEFKNRPDHWSRLLELTGFSDVYVVADMGDLLDKRPVVIATVPDTPAQQQMAELMLREWFGAVHRMDSLLVACSDRQWQRLTTIQPAARPELAAAFQACGESTAQLLILPTDDTRRVIEELSPELPKHIGGTPSSVITRGAQWIALALQTQPSLSIQLVVQSADEQAAVELHELWVQLLQVLAQDRGARQVVPNLDKTAEVLTPVREGDRLALRLDEENQGAASLAEALKAPAAKANQSTTINNLKRLALALHRYYENHKRFPAFASYDAEGNPLLSWRVHVLPYVDQQPLFDEFHLDEPWDSEHNRKLIERMPEVFRSPLTQHAGQGKTNYVLPTGEHAMFSGREGPQFKDLTDGSSNTIMILEVDDAEVVTWTKPDDLEIDPDDPLHGLGNLVEGHFHAAMGDGSVRRLPNTIPPATLRGALTPAGRELVDLP